MKIADILKLTRASTTAPTPTPEAEQAAIEAALDALDAERSTAQLRLNEIATARDALLLDPGSDRQIRDLDNEADAIRINLERFDAAESALLNRMRVSHGEQRHAEGREIRVRYADAIDRFAEALRAAADARGRLIHLRDEAIVKGFEGEIEFMELPTVSAGINYATANRFQAAATEALSIWAERAAAAAPGSHGSRHVIEFIKPMAPYHAGERASFGTAEAHAFVAAGLAKFIDERRAPPPPAVKMERK